MNESNIFVVLWRMFRRYRWHVLALVVFGFLSAILEGIGINAAIPLISFFTGDGAQATDFISRAIQGLFHFLSIPFSFRYLLGFILCLFVLRAVSVVVFGYIRGWITADFLGKESEDMLRRTLLASWPFLLRQKIGTLHNTLVRDIQHTGSLLDVVGQIIQSFSGFLMYLLVAINISPLMTFYTLLGGVFVLGVARPFLRRARHVGESVAGIEKQFAQFLSEHIIGMKSIKAAGAERAAILSGNGHIQTLRTLSIRSALLRSASSSFFQPFSLVLVIVLFLLTYHSPGFNIISFAAGLYLIQKIFTYLESTQSALHSLTGLLPYAENVIAFKKVLGDERETKINGEKSFLLEKGVEFRDVSLAYQDSDPVLKGVTFTIPKGKVVGLIGPSGSGKTSVADLLLRLLTPTKGDIVVDDEPLANIHIQSWRDNLGYVSQDIFLLNDSIEENIRFYRNLSTEEITHAAKQANIHDFIVGLPDGYATVTGDRGVMLSGGQRQRIALARALAGRPALLILDEATSALDSESEKVVQEAIHALRGSVTVFVIAHRISTLEGADTILVLDQGRIVEQGSPQELEAQENSYFYRVKHGRL